MQVETEVVRSRALTASIHFISVLRPPDFRFEPGQHAMVRLETLSGSDDRFLSMASAPSDELLDFAVRISGSEFKEAFRSLGEGDRIRLVGPSGRFRRNPNRPAILLSGGIGITPLRSMVRDAVHREGSPPTVLVFGNRTPLEIPFREELAELGESAGVRVLHTVEEPDGSWPGRVGRIGPEILAEAVRDLPESPSYYVCGPPGMVETMLRLLAGLGVGADDVLSEHFTGYRGGTT